MRAQLRPGTDTSVADTTLNASASANIGLSEGAFRTGAGDGAPAGLNAAGVGAYFGAGDFSSALSSFIGSSATGSLSGSPFSAASNGFVPMSATHVSTGTPGAHGDMFGAHTSGSLLGALGTGGDTGTVAGGTGRDFSFGSSDGVGDASGAGLTVRLAQYSSGGTFHFSGNQDVDAVLIGSKWSITNLTYSFPTSNAFYNTPYYKPDLPAHQVVLNLAQQNAAKYAFGLISGYTNLTFTQVTESANTHGNIRISQTSSSQEPSAEGNFPGSTPSDGDIWIGQNNQPFYLTPNIGNWGQATFMHEIGHTMGLKHGHSDYTTFDLSAGGYVDGPGPRYGTAALPSNHDGQDWSLMTYRSDPGNSPTTFEGNQFDQPQTYMQDDIAALQYMYGANFSTNGTNSVYTFSATTGEMFINGVSQGDPDGAKILRTVWDGNGIDTYDFSNYSNNESIDLAPGAFSTFSTAQLANHRAYTGGTATAAGNIANALLYNGDTRSLIENANGGSGNDTMSGNQANNTLNGNDGNDVINGLLGNDTLNGGAGNDTINGGDGADTITGGTGTDTVHGGNGNDTITSSGHGTYFGEANNDYMYAGIGSDETLDGGTGFDTLDTTLWNGEYTINMTTGVTDYGESFINFENLITGDGNDTITGSSAANLIITNGGDDVIITGGGADTVYGGDGNDTITSSGAGYYSGGNGDDLMYAGLGSSETLDGGAGTDTLNTTLWNGEYTINMVTGVTDYSPESFINFENLTSGNGADTITGTAGDNVINTNGGNDVIYGGDGNDTLNGGDGNDIINGGGTFTGTDTVDGGNGNDTITSSGAGTYQGGAGNDYMYANLGVNEVLDGGANTDTLDTTLFTGDYTVNLATGATNYGGESFVNFENLNSGSGNDTLTGTSGINVINGGAGNDSITGGGGADTLNGEAGDDYLWATGFGNTSLNGGVGNDYIGGGFSYGGTWDGGDGIDTVDETLHDFKATYDLTAGTYTTANGVLNILNFENVVAGTKNDTINGTTGANNLNGGAGDDIINGNGGGDTIHGGLGNDILDAGSSNNSFVYGDDGDDLVYAVFGTPETADGGAGTDTLNTTSFSGDYVINLATGLTNFSTESFTNFENLISGSGNDTLTGTSGDNIIHGGDGNDHINSGDGVDSVYGDAGDDVLDGSYGWDALIDGGTGSDTVDYSWIGSGFESINIVIDLSGTGWTSTQGNETLVSIENVEGTQSGETIIGTADDNTLNGNGGNDTITGGLGHDTLNGGDGNDIINAGPGNSGPDTVDGGNGNDTIISSGDGTYLGGAGNDIMFAGLTVSTESMDGGAGTDTLNTTLFSGDYVVNLGTGVTNYSGESYVNFENLVSGDGNDTLTGSTGVNVISGGNGNDTIDTGGGSDTLNGDDGNDHLWASAFAHTTLNGGTGDDYLGGGFAYGGTWDGGDGVDTIDMTLHDFKATYDLTAGTYTTANGVLNILNFENIVAGSKDDTLNGSAADNVLNGNAGNDTINGLAGNDMLDGGTGNDTINGGDGNDIIVAGANDGDDNSVDTVDGGAGDDTIWSSGMGSYMGGDGNDLIYAGLTGASPESLDGGNGVDTLDTTSWDGAYIINLATGSSNYGGETFTNFENVTTGDADDDLTGTSGDNIINGGVGADKMTGGLGNDSYYVDNAGDVVVEATGAGTDTVYSTLTYTLAGTFIENLTLLGTDNNNATGSTAANVLTGNSGNNVLDGGAGGDTMAGREGNDTYVVDSSLDVVVENASEGTDLVKAGVSFILGANLENLTLTGTLNRSGYGNALDNVITGNTGDNSLKGYDGNDTLNGAVGADTMVGGNGDDVYYVDNVGDVVTENANQGSDKVFAFISYTMAANVERLTLSGATNIDGTGNALANTMAGNTGANTLDGGAGNDLLTGGLGADIFLFNLGSGVDKITDFNAGQNDMINVHAYTGGTAHTAYLTQSGSDTKMDLGGGNVITIVGATYNDPNLLSHIVW